MSGENFFGNELTVAMNCVQFTNGIEHLLHLGFWEKIMASKFFLLPVVDESLVNLELLEAHCVVYGSATCQVKACHSWFVLHICQFVPKDLFEMSFLLESNVISFLRMNRLFHEQHRFVILWDLARNWAYVFDFILLNLKVLNHHSFIASNPQRAIVDVFLVISRTSELYITSGIKVKVGALVKSLNFNILIWELVEWLGNLMQSLIVLHEFDNIRRNWSIQISQAYWVPKAPKKTQLQKHCFSGCCSEPTLNNTRPFELNFWACKHIQLVFKGHSSFVEGMHCDATL